MNVETVIRLNKFVPREYQLPIFDAIENKGYRRVLIILPRRAGKDISAFNLVLRQALKKVGVYFYVFPTYSQGRRAIWDTLSNDGMRFLDYIPPELIESSNSQEMKIRLRNGSLIQIVGSDNFDSLRGSNPRGVVFSEYAWQDPRVYQVIRPILTGNQGWSLFISTPNGKNHFWSLYNIALESKEWYCLRLTVDDTKHVTQEDIDIERREGIDGKGGMSEDMIQQEYYCSFDLGVDGSYYARYFTEMRLKGQIGSVPWEPGFKVNTFWDLGMSDSTCIIFAQNIGQTVRIIDYYENSGHGLEHYSKVLQNKPYSYGKHVAPHDIQVRELGSGMSRLEKARQLGVSFIIAPNLSVIDGIEAVRSVLPKVWIDQTACSKLIKALENYRKELDAKKEKYKDHPLHNWASHAADAMRYLAVSLPKTRDGASAEDLEKRYFEALYGHNANMPSVFRDDLPGY